jgi:hypothetical protein
MSNNNYTDKAIVNAAKRLHEEEGELEIDPASDPLPAARVSRSAEGAYVLAWVWVPYDSVGK